MKSERDIAAERLKQHNKELQQVQETLRQVENHNEGMISEILVTRRSAYAGEEETQRLEKEKKKQDFLLASLHEQERSVASAPMHIIGYECEFIRSLKKYANTLEEQLKAQKEQSVEARKTLSMAQEEMVFSLLSHLRSIIRAT
jgi:predicted  nucleic acid-binding Zn-ribbon protein